MTSESFLYLDESLLAYMLHSCHWQKMIPSFNTASMKAELRVFAESILEQCRMDKISFGVEGIEQHVCDYFNEQRRVHSFKKRKLQVCTFTSIRTF